jgi:hypothetical protein
MRTHRYLVDVGSIKTNPNQPRKIFKEKDLEELWQNRLKRMELFSPSLLQKWKMDNMNLSPESVA